MKHILKYIPKKTTVIPCLFFSVIFSATLVIGKSLYIFGNFNGIVASGAALLSAALGVLGYTLLFTILFSIITEIILKFQNQKKTQLWKIFQYPWIYWGIIFLCWLPCYLAYYPGIISYDMHEQMAQALGTVAYSKYHPPLHTFVWDMCLTLEVLTGLSGLVIYSVLQMLLLSFAFTYMLRFFIKKNVGNVIILLTLLFICFNPVIAIFSFIPVKDALFAVFFILYSVELCSFVCDKEAYLHNFFSISRLILFAILCCLLRNNMVYSLFVATVFMVLAIKKYWKNILLWNAIIIAVYSIISGPFYSMLGIKDGNSREMLSIPIQQITYVVAHYDGTISQDTIQRIDKYLPYEELPRLYNPRLADYAKVVFNTQNFEENKSDFLKLWFDLFKEYPDEYLVAFLNLNLPYWYIDANSVDEYSKRDYIETYIMESNITNYEVIRCSKIPWLYEEYEMYADYKFKKDSPIVETFFSISTPIWLLLMGVTVLFAGKRKDSLVAYAPAVCYWLTFMLGPVSNFRYIFPLVTLYPLYSVLILDRMKTE